MTIWSSPVVFASLPGASQELLGKSAEAVHGPTFFAFPVLTTVLIQGWLRAASVLCVVPVLRGGEKTDQQEMGWLSATGCVFPPPHTASQAIFSPCGPVHLLSDWVKQNQKGRRVLILETLLTGAAARKWPTQIFSCTRRAIPTCLSWKETKRF